MSKTLQSNITKNKFMTHSEKDVTQSAQKKLENMKTAKQIRKDAEQDQFWSEFNSQGKSTNKGTDKNYKTLTNTYDNTAVGTSNNNPLTANG